MFYAEEMLRCCIIFEDDSCFTRCCHMSGLAMLLPRLSSALISKRSCVACVAEATFMDNTQKRYACFAYISTLQESVGHKSAS